MPLAIDVGDVRTAAARLAGVAHRTPVITSRTLDDRTGARLFLKAENLQRVGAFKFRGAYNRVASLTDAELRAGVTAGSSGNHAQALALAARLCGARATILMPADAPASKRAATEGYGAEVIAYDRYTEDRDTLARELADDRGMVLVPPYDDPWVIAGQGTTALELCEDVDELDVLVVCTGGGGLTAGCAVAATALRPGIRIVGVEPEAGDDTRRSLAAGERVSIAVPRTIADGLQASVPGELTFEVNRTRVDE
ncbi:MAG: threo-3-hydroxy-L-aspartate ammonia-lyase, partial [Solirubrobacteraceae bacterium]|nr:threo-3-hydroxy-L-aspartate ammonia-lyase [Solirubrobacteraceae bacterium]